MLEVKVNIIQILNFGAIINGLIFSILLLKKKENKGANRFLALLLFSLGFTVATSFILEFGLYNVYPFLHWFPFTLTFWIGPAFYFYIKQLIEPGFRFQKQHYWHFSLVIFNYFHSIYHLIYGRTFPHPLFHNFTEAVGTYALILVMLYLFVAYKEVSRYQLSILDQLSTTDEVQLNWIKQLIRTISIAFGVMLLIKLVDYKELIDYSVDSYEGSLFVYRDYVQLIIAFTIYWLSFGGFRQLQTFNDPLRIDQPRSEKDYSQVVKKLLNIMEEQNLFLNPQLDLKMLSQATSLSTKEISAALNQHLDKNFYWFVNEYRVKEAKVRLADPKYNHLKILGIAYDCGFNSKATFNRIFKEITGQSPKAFRNL